MRITLFAGMVEVAEEISTNRQTGGGARGRIYGFSRASRRRLMKKLAKCRRRPDHFMTLTYPDEFPDVKRSKYELRLHLDNWLRIHKNQNKSAYAIWRLEKQRRGAPHFHCLLWTDLDSPTVGQTWVKNKRWRVALEKFGGAGTSLACYMKNGNGSWKDWLCWHSVRWWLTTRTDDIDHLRSGTDLAEVQNWRSVWSYVAKYVGKLEHGSWVDHETGEMKPVGRLWGAKGDASMTNPKPLSETEYDDLRAFEIDRRELLERIDSDYAVQLEREGRRSFFVFINEEESRQIDMAMFGGDQGEEAGKVAADAALC